MPNCVFMQKTSRENNYLQTEAIAKYGMTNLSIANNFQPFYYEMNLHDCWF